MPTDVQREQVQWLQAEGAQLVDVLPREEYENEHLAGAINVRLGELTPKRARYVLAQDRPIVVYCQNVE